MTQKSSTASDLLENTIFNRQVPELSAISSFGLAQSNPAETWPDNVVFWSETPPSNWWPDDDWLFGVGT